VAVDHDGGRTSETTPGSRPQTSALQEQNEQVIHVFDVPDAWSAAIERQAP
jgi:hypothetical protein